MVSLNYYYRVLNLEPGSTREDIKQAYRKLAHQWHPDKFLKKPEQLKEAREQFERIKEAYDKLLHFSSADAQATISVRPANAEELYEEGIAYLQRSQHEQAVESFTQAIRRRPKFLKAYQARAFTLEQMGLHRRAKVDFETVADLKRQAQSTTSRPIVRTEKREE